MRSGELLLGLQRRDIDSLHRTVTVERQAHELTGLGRVLTPPKSEAGRRTVALRSFVLHALEDHLCDFVAPAIDAFVFTRSTGLPLRRQDLSVHGRLPAPWSASTVCAPRSAPPRRHGDRKESERHPPGAHGHHRPFVLCGRPPLPARHGGAERGNRRLSRRRDQCRTATGEFTAVHNRSSGLSHECGMERTRFDSFVAERIAPTRRRTGGGGRNRTAVRGFAGPCLNHSATPPCTRWLGSRTPRRRTTERPA
jgi:hypothetical protein